MTKPSRAKKQPVALELHQPDLGPIEKVALDLLKPFEANARTHDQRQIAKLAQSLQVFGWTNPLLATGDGTIIAGHGRWLAAKKLGLTHAQVVRIEHLNDAQVRAYRIADNRLAELSGWDDELLALELGQLGELDLDFNIEVTGFDHAEIDVRLDKPEKTEEGPRDPADADGIIAGQIAVSRPGDMWILGKHRLFCGSALEQSSFDQLMAGEQATMIFQDAPYNCPVNGHVSGLGKVKHREFEMASGEMTRSQFQAFLTTNLSLAASCLVEGGIASLCMDWRNTMILQQALEACGLSLINLAVWAKSNGGMGALYRSQHELVLIGKKGSAPHINNVELGKHGRYRTNIWRYAGVNSFGAKRMEQLEVHPTVKPIPLVADAIRDVSNRGNIILDSFMGSGTTLLAAERTGRVAYGMDLDPLYVDVAIRRWQKMTKLKAVLASSGRTFAEVESNVD
jgi:DNA modification methylase